MSASAKTFRDRTMIALAIVPPVALLLFCVSAAATWQSGAAQVRPMLERSFPSELIDAPLALAAGDTARTSKEHTHSYRELSSAINALNDQYHLLFELLNEQEDLFENLDEEHPIDKYLDGYLTQAAPLLDMAKQLKLNEASIGHADEFGNPNHYSSGLISIRGLPEMLRAEFRDAVRAKQTDRAMEAFRIFHALEIRPTNQDSLRILPLVSQSIATGIWSESELGEIVQLVETSPDLNQAWQDRIRSTTLAQIPWLLRGEIVETWRRDWMPTTFAPSRRIAWLDRNHEFSRVGGIGTFGAIKRVMKLQEKFRRESRSALDLALQIPGYHQYYSPGQSNDYIATVYTRVANERRHARTAAAVATYKLTFGQYPASLDDLARVNLPVRETLDPLGAPFQFESDGETCELANAAIWFTDGRGRSGTFGSREGTLSSILQQLVVLKFR
ncbi:hypothetical protein Mal15_45720 [Stieleria maiorica]|uniref:Uncharacterized protein n=1 Tax=Stieleria maiorica TaxID=2795974 RepID=A0A5B9MGU5_9BACT|nr:hypothetical protein [Stieleria maiorica]QEG00502.1 hypothetical protein Mal15_45720 [Stieleria maiorica]